MGSRYTPAVLATIQYRKHFDTPAYSTFAGIFATEQEAEQWCKIAFYGTYKNGVVITQAGGRLKLTPIAQAVNVVGSLVEVTNKPFMLEGN